MVGGEPVEQLALHLRAGQAGGFLLELALEQTLELVEALEPERLGEVLVDLGLAGNLEFLDGDVEFGLLPGEMLGRIVLGEGHGDGLLIARFHAGQLLFEAGDELARAEHQRGAFGLTAFELGAVDAADKVDDQLVAVGGLLRLGRVLVALLVLGQLGERLVDFGIGHRHDQLLELEVVNGRHLDLGQHFELDGQLGVLALLVTVAQIDLGLQRRAQLVRAHQLVDRFAHRGVEGVGMERLSVHLSDEVGGHLAGPETGHAHLRGNFLHLGIDPRLDILGGNGHAVSALEAFVGGLDDLHS